VRVVLFTGKGGVGKTTLAAATAVHLAAAGRPALAVSTDPAHSLGDALEADLDGEPRELAPGLWGAHIETRALLDRSWAELQGHLRTLLAGAGVDELVADELTVLPGVEDLLALGEVRRFADGGPHVALDQQDGDAAQDQGSQNRGSHCVNYCSSREFRLRQKRRYAGRHGRSGEPRQGDHEDRSHRSLRHRSEVRLERHGYPDHQRENNSQFQRPPFRRPSASLPA